METLVAEQNISLTYFTEQNTYKKLIEAHQFIFPVLERLDCTHYSETIEQLIVILVAFSPETYPEPEKLRFRRTKKEIEIRINMDYKTLLEATETETLHLIAKTYLLAVERFLSKRKDFDHKRFYADVRKVFEQNRLLPNTVFSKKSVQKIRKKFLSTLK